MSQVSLPAIAAPLLQWFEQHKRPLPWREDREPYHVWVSEIMLQQTRIEPVKKYYRAFMKALPTVEALSRVPEEQLLKLWEGLGYYSRARNLQKAARVIMNDYNGRFPVTYRELLKLPGIGEYTAGAIASICFNEKIPAVDGNVLRVLARLLASSKNVLLPETKKEAFRLLMKSMPQQAGNFNEALMELGETVCLPGGAPLCEHCPLRELCAANKEHLTDKLPVRIKQLKRRQEHLTVLLLRTDDGRIALEKRPDKGLLAGMYQLPNLSGTYTDEELAVILSEWQLEPQSICTLTSAKHVFTHVDWLMQGYEVTVARADRRFIWVTPDELTEHYALPTAFRPFICLL